ncbi:MAG: hypothetical protein IT392_07950 [Nitrospirae bacterium]|nr:hypothetical protein [Nitrospirota bacterium]
MAYLKTGRHTKLILRLTHSLLLLSSFILLLTSNASPARAATQWSLSAVEGYYLPGLNDLNYVLKNIAVELGPRNTEAKPVSYPVIYQGFSPKMPEMSPERPKAGLQLQADINTNYAVVFGGTIATFDSSARDIRPFFVGFSIDATRETRFSLSLNQFWLGVKRYWEWEKTDEMSRKPGEGSMKPEGEVQKSGEKKTNARLYAEMGILAITRAYLTTDVWLHVYAPEEGFDFYKVTETGINGSGYATYVGVGGEYFVKKWLSLGMDIDYTVGKVGNMRYARYFTVDPLEKDIIKTGDKVLYADLLKGQLVPLFLDLNGWDFKGQVRVYFK